MKTKRIITIIGYPLILCLMVSFAYLWNNFWNEQFYDGAQCFLLENRSEDIKRVTLCVFKEEFIWRLCPIFILSSIFLVIKTKLFRLIFSAISVIIVVYIQIIFGAKHYNLSPDFPCTYNIIIQGGTGIILSITYIIIMYYTLKINSQKAINNTRIKARKFIVANIIAYCTSSIVHALSNVIIVLTQTF